MLKREGESKVSSISERKGEGEGTHFDRSLEWNGLKVRPGIHEELLGDRVPLSESNPSSDDWVEITARKKERRRKDKLQ